RMVEEQMAKLFGLRQDRLAKKGHRTRVGSMHVRPDQWQLLPDDQPRTVGQVIKAKRLDVRSEAQHVHVRLTRQAKIAFEQLVGCGVEEKLGYICGTAHEHAPAIDGERPALGARLERRLANPKVLVQVGA